MAERRASVARPPPVLREGAVFHGLLVLPGPGYIDGSVSGEVLAAGDIWVGPGGAVHADLEAHTIVVEGRVEGDLVAREKVVLHETARVRGCVTAPRLCMAEGSRVDGPCRTGLAAGPGGPEHGAEAPDSRPGSP